MSPKCEYLCCWFMLHRLADIGQDESDLADELREEMEYLANRLPHKTIVQMGSVSAALNAERDVITAERTGRVKELDGTLRWLAEEYWKR